MEIRNNHFLKRQPFFKQPFLKETNNNMYLHLRSFAPITWKKGTLRTLIRRAYTVCSNEIFCRKNYTI